MCDYTRNHSNVIVGKKQCPIHYFILGTFTPMTFKISTYLRFSVSKQCTSLYAPACTPGTTDIDNKQEINAPKYTESSKLSTSSDAHPQKVTRQHAKTMFLECLFTCNSSSLPHSQFAGPAHLHKHRGYTAIMMFAF